MPGCASSERTPIGLLALLLWLGGCSASTDRGHFEISHLEANWSNGQVRVRCAQRLTLSAEAREALRHGVPLTLETELILRNADSQTRVGGDRRSFEVRYLPLSEHYQIAGIGLRRVATFPRLRHALAQLSQLDLTLETGALPAGNYEILARSRLDRRRMPPPMRLPALFDPRWKHVSAWTSSPLTVDPEA